MGDYLVIANQTLQSSALHGWALDAVARSRTRCRFHVVVPAARVGRRLTWTEGESVAAARRRLTDAVARLAGLGALVDGEIGDEDPVLAATDALRRRRYDAVVVSTLPAGSSRWTHRDVVTRLRQASAVPVVHVEAGQPALVGI